MTQQFNVNHGHPDGDLMTSILAYEWYLECRRNYDSKYADWQITSAQEWKACTRLGLIHHVLVAIHESVQVLKHTFDEHRQLFPEVPTPTCRCTAVPRHNTQGVSSGQYGEHSSRTTI